MRSVKQNLTNIVWYVNKNLQVFSAHIHSVLCKIIVVVIHDKCVPKDACLQVWQLKSKYKYMSCAVRFVTLKSVLNSTRSSLSWLSNERAAASPEGHSLVPSWPSFCCFIGVYSTRTDRLWSVPMDTALYLKMLHRTNTSDAIKWLPTSGREKNQTKFKNLYD